MSNTHLLLFIFVWMGCQSHRNNTQSGAYNTQSFQLPFFKDAESLNRELGLLRMRQLEDVENISVLAELTAGFTLQAMMSDSEDNQRSLELAKQYGILCLRTSSGFESLLQSRGLRITPKAVNVIEDEPHLKDCKQWTGIAWSLWLIERGVLGASIDVKSVQAMSPQNPKSSLDYYQIALNHALDLDPDKDDIIRESLLKASKKSVIPHRMHYEQWRLIDGEASEDWLRLLKEENLSALNGVETAAIRRVFPERFDVPSQE